LLVNRTRVVVDHMNLNVSGDALTTYSTAYIFDTALEGDGDTVLGYSSVFWNQSTVITTAGAVSWPRTVQRIHGNVKLNCTIIALEGNSIFGRHSDNSGGVMDN
jgi:pectinesterase